MHRRDEVDIERLVTWALRDQGLGWDAPARGGPIGQIAMLGTRVEGGTVRSPSISLLTDDDAPLVAAAVGHLPEAASYLVWSHGRAGTRPAGAEDPMPELRQMRNKRGQLMWEYADRGRKQILGPKLDRNAQQRESRLVLFGRQQWTVWREALIALIEPLNREMEHHRAVGPRAPAEPWVLQPVVHGIELSPPSTRPQPWLDPLARTAEPDMLLDDRIAAAREQVRAVATDWSVPEHPIERSKSRQRRGKKTVLESASGRSAHGRS